MGVGAACVGSTPPLFIACLLTFPCQASPFPAPAAPFAWTPHHPPCRRFRGADQHTTRASAARPCTPSQNDLTGTAMVPPWSPTLISPTHSCSQNESDDRSARRIILRPEARRTRLETPGNRLLAAALTVWYTGCYVTAGDVTASPVPYMEGMSCEHWSRSWNLSASYSRPSLPWPP
jgi:hypothetical protein